MFKEPVVRFHAMGWKEEGPHIKMGQVYVVCRVVWVKKKKEKRDETRQISRYTLYTYTTTHKYYTGEQGTSVTHLGSHVNARIIMHNSFLSGCPIDNRAPINLENY